MSDKRQNMIYTVKQYRDKFHKDKSERSVLRMVSRKMIPSYHIATKNGHDWVIDVRTAHESAELYCEACFEFHERKKNRHRKEYVEICAELSVEYNISITKLTKILGV